MIVVHLVLIIVLVTIDAREDTIIRGVVVAVRASVPFPIVVAAVDREELIIVVECRIAPIRFIMTLRAVGAETRSGVVRIVGAIVIGHMTGAACGRRTGITVRMAFDASRCFVRTMQREVRYVMVERSGPSGSCGMASGTIRGEPGKLVAWVGGVLVVRQVAADTFRRCIGEVPRCVAARTIIDRVAPGEREEIMVSEFGSPTTAHWIMAFDAVHGKS